jgi:capsular exopolysaccharide synthesis family protein
MKIFDQIIRQASHQNGVVMNRLFGVSKATKDAARSDRLPTKVLVHKRGTAPSKPSDSVGRIDPHLVSLVSPDSIEAEQYRGLRYVVEQMRKTGEEGGVVIGVCSAVPGDGKSITAINLAGSLAQDPKARVLLMEVDLRRPSVTVGDHLALGNYTGHSLMDAMLNPQLTLEAVTRYLPAYNLSVLPAGYCPRAPYEVLKSPRLSELLAQARKRYDYVILDAPPIVPVPDCRLMSQMVDGFLLIVAARRTPRWALEEALDTMGPDKILGLVFNGLDRSAARNYRYYSYANPKTRNETSWWQRLRFH